LRGGGDEHPPCHREERSDVAIQHFLSENARWIATLLRCATQGRQPRSSARDDKQGVSSLAGAERRGHPALRVDFSDGSPRRCAPRDDRSGMFIAPSTQAPLPAALALLLIATDAVTQPRGRISAAGSPVTVRNANQPRLAMPASTLIASASAVSRLSVAPSSSSVFCNRPATSSCPTNWAKVRAVP
jgi:hypothetical protein